MWFAAPVTNDQYIQYMNRTNPSKLEMLRLDRVHKATIAKFNLELHEEDQTDLKDKKRRTGDFTRSLKAEFASSVNEELISEITGKGKRFNMYI